MAWIGIGAIRKVARGKRERSELSKVLRPLVTTAPPIIIEQFLNPGSLKG